MTPQRQSNNFIDTYMYSAIRRTYVGAAPKSSRREAGFDSVRDWLDTKLRRQHLLNHVRRRRSFKQI